MPKGSGKQLTPEQQERLEASEAWFKIVVKVLRWKDGATVYGDLKPIDKISKKEWKQYCETMLSKNISAGTKNTQEALNKTKEAIMYYNGFESA